MTFLYKNMSLPTLSSMITGSGAPQQIPASGSSNNQQGGQQGQQWGPQQGQQQWGPQQGQQGGQWGPQQGGQQWGPQQGQQQWGPQQGGQQWGPQQGGQQWGPQQGQQQWGPQQGQQGGQGYQGWNQQGGFQPGYAQQGGQYQTTPQTLNNWQQEMYNFQTHYQVTIPQNEIDNTFEDAKRNNRRYKFKDAETNYVKYSNDGKSYISIADASGWAHKNNSQYWGSQVNLPNSYEGKTSRLKNVCFIDTHFQFHHVKPGNYKLFINHGFENQALLNKLTLKVFVGDKEVYNLNDYPNQAMIGLKQLTETYICDIRSDQFDTSKLDQNGDAVVKVCFAGKEGSWKKGWLIDGARLLAC